MRKKIIADSSTKQHKITIGELFVNDTEKAQTANRAWLLKSLDASGVGRVGVNRHRAPQNITYPVVNMYYEAIYEKGREYHPILAELLKQGWLQKVHNPRSRYTDVKWTIDKGPDSRVLRESGFSKSDINKAWEIYNLVRSDKYIASILGQLKTDNKMVVLTGGLYSGCLRAIYEYLLDRKDSDNNEPLRVVVFEPAIFPHSTNGDISDRADFIELTRIEKPNACCYVDGRVKIKPVKGERPNVFLDIYSSKESFDSHFDNQSSRFQRVTNDAE